MHRYMVSKKRLKSSRTRMLNRSLKRRHKATAAVAEVDLYFMGLKTGFTKKVANRAARRESKSKRCS